MFEGVWFRLYGLWVMDNPVTLAEEKGKGEMMLQGSEYREGVRGYLWAEAKGTGKVVIQVWRDEEDKGEEHRIWVPDRRKARRVRGKLEVLRKVIAKGG